MKAANTVLNVASKFKGLVDKEGPLGKFCELLGRMSTSSVDAVKDFADYATLTNQLRTSLAPSSDVDLSDAKSVSLEGFKAITLSLVNGLDQKMNIKKDQNNLTPEQANFAKLFGKTIADNNEEFKGLSSDQSEVPNPKKALNNLQEKNPDPSLKDAFKNAAMAILNLLKSLLKALFGLVMGEEEAQQKKQEEDAEKMFGDFLKFLGASPNDQQANKDQTRQNLMSEYGATEPKAESLDDIFKDLTGEVNSSQSGLEKAKAQMREWKKELDVKLPSQTPDSLGVEQGVIGEEATKMPAKSELSPDINFKNDSTLSDPSEPKQEEDLKFKADKLGADLKTGSEQVAKDKAKNLDDKPKSWVDRVKPAATENQKGSQEASF